MNPSFPRRRFLQVLAVSVLALPFAAFARRVSEDTPSKTTTSVPSAPPPERPDCLAHRPSPDKADAHRAAVEEVHVLFPDLPKEHIGSWAMTTTAYPMVPLAECLPGLRDLSRRFNGDHQAAWAWSEAEFERTMREAAAEES